jgi:[ribosomal protein S5]-alanine N-acetyltransferase
VTERGRVEGREDVADAMTPERKASDMLARVQGEPAEPGTRLPRLVSDRSVLRLPMPDDVALLVDYFTRSGSRYDPPFPSDKITHADLLAQIDRGLSGYQTGRSFLGSVFAPDETSILGSAALNHIIRGTRHSAWLSFAIAKPWEGSGVMLETCRALLSFAFGELNLHRLEATHDPSNLRSARLLQRLGFQQVGVLPQFHRSKERWHDSILMTLVNTHWRAPETATNAWGFRSDK